MDNPYPICENCIFVDEPLDKDPCQECNRAFLAQRIKPNFVSKRKPKTNYDRIISKTPKELADFFAPRGCPWILEEPCPECGTTCNKCWLDWLKQECADEST